MDKYKGFTEEVKENGEESCISCLHVNVCRKWNELAKCATMRKTIKETFYFYGKQCFDYVNCMDYDY